MFMVAVYVLCNMYTRTNNHITCHVMQSLSAWEPEHRTVDPRDRWQGGLQGAGILYVCVGVQDAVNLSVVRERLVKRVPIFCSCVMYLMINDHELATGGKKVGKQTYPSVGSIVHT